MNRYKIMEYIFEVFDPSLPRLGPGDSASTKKALDMLFSAMSPDGGGANSGPHNVLDLGCGNGAQTIQLAKHVDGLITAVDNHKPFLDELRRRSKAAGVSEKIKPCLKDMNALDLEKESFDIIWAEGSLYNAGFAKGLEICRDLLVPGGFLAASELAWFRPDAPKECSDFYAETYPVMADIDTNLETIKSCGFEVVGHFTLSRSAWLESFYDHLEDRLVVLRERYAEDQDWMEVIESFQKEIDICRRYSDYYGYVFYVMRRTKLVFLMM